MTVGEPRRQRKHWIDAHAWIRWYSQLESFGRCDLVFFLTRRKTIHFFINQMSDLKECLSRVWSVFLRWALNLILQLFDGKIVNEPTPALLLLLEQTGRFQDESRLQSAPGGPLTPANVTPALAVSRSCSCQKLHRINWQLKLVTC